MYNHRRNYGCSRLGAPVLPLAAVILIIAVLIVLLILLGVLAVVLVGILVLGTVLIGVLALVIHYEFPPILVIAGHAAVTGCPETQDLSLGRKRKLTINPAKMAAAMPPAQDFSPPVRTPRKPCS